MKDYYVIAELHEYVQWHEGTTLLTEMFNTTPDLLAFDNEWVYQRSEES